MIRPIGGLLLYLYALAAAALPTLPADSADIHQGVRTCANSNCHNAKRPGPFSYIGQNEFSIWNSKDRHAKSYKALQSPAATAIARRLGQADATQMQSCLSCHTDNVPAARRGKNFALSDGVACEACHGGAQHWLASHSDTTSTHAQNVAAGMYPTEDPVARARLCMRCHVGTPENPMTHRLLGAGHSRLALELDSFTLARPAHHVDDADYRQRKPGQFPLRTWALGQIQSAIEWQRLHVAIKPGGMWPEFSFYECFGCHRKKDRETADGVFQPRLDISSLVMTRVVLERVMPQQAATWKSLMQTLRRPANAYDQQRALSQIGTLSAQALAAAERYAFKTGDAQPYMHLLEQYADAGEFDRYDAAEQATYAAAVIVATQNDDVENSKANAAMEALYQAVDDSSRFATVTWRAKLKAVGDTIR